MDLDLDIFLCLLPSIAISHESLQRTNLRSSEPISYVLTRIEISFSLIVMTTSFRHSSDSTNSLQSNKSITSIESKFFN